MPITELALLVLLLLRRRRRRLGRGRRQRLEERHGQQHQPARRSLPSRRRTSYRSQPQHDEAAKKKFKNLRDQFRFELKKAPAGKSGDSGLSMEDYFSTWPWFKKLFFLRDQMHGRTTTGKLSCTPMKRKYDVQQECEGDGQASDISHSDVQDISHKELAPPTTHTKKKVSQFQCDFLDIEKQKLEILMKQSEEENDSDRMFLLSLLPAIKTLEPQKAQLFRLKVHQLLYEAQYSPEFGKQVSMEINL